MSSSTAQGWLAYCHPRTRLFRAVAVGVVLLVVLTLLIPSQSSRFLRPAPWSKQSHHITDDHASSTHDSAPDKHEGQDWSQFAYSLYVTNEAYLCNAVMMADSLHKVKAAADRLILYPEQWVDRSIAGAYVTKLLSHAEKVGAKLVPIAVQHFDGGDPTWSDSYTKLLAFNQTSYKRVLSLDTDATVMQNMDELFFHPATPIAAPRAYWLPDGVLSSQIVLIEPSAEEFERVNEHIQHHNAGDFDMEIINELYTDVVSEIPPRRWDLLTGEFRATDHKNYLGADAATTVWNATDELAQAKFIHFSDWPLPKPWLAGEQQVDARKPDCYPSKTPGGPLDCSDQKAWLWMYSDFRERKQRVCDS